MRETQPILTDNDMEMGWWCDWVMKGDLVMSCDEG